jgi:DNA (cytosine-5)-methyltransferase 1
MKKYSIISLFTGCGGLDLGFVGGFAFLDKFYPKNNFEITWANDIDKASCETFRKNLGHDIVYGDITELLNGNHSPSLFEKSLPEHADIVLGGFPCQDFSHAGKRKGFNAKRGLLYQSMIEVIKRTKPSVFVAENVKGLMTMNGGEALRTIIRDFETLGYNAVYKLLMAADYGVPQIRERVIIVGTKKDRLPPFKHPEPLLSKNNWVSLRKAIGDLEHLAEGKVANHYWSKAKMFAGTQGNTIVSPDKPGPTMRTEHHGNIEWHWNKRRRLSAREAARIQSFPDDFVFYPSTSSAYKQIGNAVPPVMAWYIAEAVQKLLDDYHSTDLLDREVLVKKSSSYPPNSVL